MWSTSEKPKIYFRFILKIFLILLYPVEIGKIEVSFFPIFQDEIKSFLREWWGLN